MGQLTVAIIGNSNSVMRHGYSAYIDPVRFDLRHMALGACPNVVLPFALTHELWSVRYDWIIFETTPTDHTATEQGQYDADQRRAALAIFLAEAERQQPQARLLCLILPLITDGRLEPLPLVPDLLDGLSAAARPVTVLNIATLYERLVPADSPLTKMFMSDRMHPSPPSQIVIGQVLTTIMASAPPEPWPEIPPVIGGGQAVVSALVPDGGTPGADRSNGLFIRPIRFLPLGETATFGSDRMLRVLALLINRQETSCGLTVSVVEGGAGSRALDLRCRSAPGWAVLVSLVPVAGLLEGTRFAIRPTPDIDPAHDVAWEIDPARETSGLEIWSVLVADVEALRLATARARRSEPIIALDDPVIAAEAARSMAEFALWHGAFARRWLFEVPQWLAHWASHLHAKIATATTRPEVMAAARAVFANMGATAAAAIFETPAPSAMLAPPPKRTVRIAVLFRTYQWDEFARRAATRLAARTAGMDLFILIDESASGPVDTAPFTKIAHTVATFKALGLPCDPVAKAPALWWNCDYGLYDAMLQQPGYDIYLAVEDDVAVNLPLMQVVERMRDRELDAIVSFGPNSVERWGHRHSLADVPYRSLSWSALSTVFLTGRAIRFLFDQRRRLAEMHAEGKMAAWPFCEGFVSSALHSEGFAVGELAQFVRLPHFSTEMPLLEDDPRAVLPDTVAHSVLSVDRFADKFRGRALNMCLATGDRATLRDLREQLLSRGVRDLGLWRLLSPAGNIALDRPARQSSVGVWSRQPVIAESDPVAIDAGGGNCGVLTGNAGFHTDVEANPWWQVDLGDRHPVGTVRLYGSGGIPGRALSIMISADGELFARVFLDIDDRVSPAYDDPFDCQITPPVLGRYVRVERRGAGSLHLGEVEVYSHPSPPMH